jgi:hypothetical protein
VELQSTPLPDAQIEFYVFVATDPRARLVQNEDKPLSASQRYAIFP